jgi:hypothetical protein
VWIDVRPVFDAVRLDPRFERLVEQVFKRDLRSEI